jgi:Zn-dependent peptidase ImmA (M78 family)
LADAAIANAAARLLRDAGVRAAPVPVDRLARRLGAELRFEPSRTGMAGLLWHDAGRIILGINSLLPRTRQRFTIAHELGHLLLHPGDGLHIDRDFRASESANDPSEVRPVDIRDLTLEALTPALTLDIEALLHGTAGARAAFYAGREGGVAAFFPNEQQTAALTVPSMSSAPAAGRRAQEANQFAAELLLPAAMVRTDLPEDGIDFEEDDSVRRLAERYQVSLQLLLRRLAELGFLTPAR